MQKTDYQDKIRKLAKSRKLEWKKHALKRLLERGITRQAVFNALNKCEIIESYIKDNPLPSFLLLGYDGAEPLHILVALDEENDLLWVITVYKPTSDEWENEFKTRRNR